MRVNLGSFLIVVMLHVGHSVSLAQDAKGWFVEDCRGAFFHVGRIAGLPGDQEPFLWMERKFPLSEYLEGWWPALVCFGPGKCDDGVQAKIWFKEEKKNLKRLSGRYAVDFGDRHLEGSFKVKYRNNKNPGICE